MQLRCYRCGWSFAIKKEELAFALSALEESHGNHYDVRCPRCRHMNRVSLEQLQKFAPRVEPTEAAGDRSEVEPAESESGEQPEDEAAEPAVESESGEQPAGETAEE